MKEIFCCNCKFLHKYHNKILYSITDALTYPFECTCKELMKYEKNYFWEGKKYSLCSKNNANNDCKFYEKRIFYCCKCNKNIVEISDIICDSCKNQKKKWYKFCK